MDHLVIITPKFGSFDKYLRKFPIVFKLNALASQSVYFTYVGIFPAKDRLCQILSFHNFKEFSIDKETNYYRLKVFVE